MAKYYGGSEFEMTKAQKRLDHFKAKEKFFELTELTTRSLRQNAKFHAMIGQIGLEMGANLKYVKLNIVKMKWCRSIFYVEDFNKKTGESYFYVRSSKDLSIEEMAKAIKIIIEKASLELGMMFPDPDDEAQNKEWVRMMQEVERNEQYL